MKVGNKLIPNTFYLFLDLASMSGLGFLFWIIMGKMLVPYEYGIVATFLNFIIFVGGITPLGLNITLMKLIPEFLKSKRTDLISSYVRYSLKWILIVTIILSAILFAVHSYLELFLKVVPEVILIAIPGIIVYTFFNTSLGIYYGYQEMKKIFLSNLAGALIKVFLSLGLIILGFSYFGALYGIIFAALVSTLLRIDKMFYKKSEKKIDKKLLTSYAVPALIGGMLLIIISNLPFVILTALKDPGVTGIFSPAMIIATLIFASANVFAQSLFPLISELSAGDKRIKQGYLIGLTTRYMLLFLLPVIFLSIVFSTYLIKLIASVEYLGAAAFFPLLIPGALIFGIGNLFLTSLYAIKKPTINRNITIVTIILFLILSFGLTTLYSSYGLSVAYLLSAVFLVIVGFFYLRKYLKINFLWKDLLKIILITLISFGSIILYRSYIPNFVTSIIVIMFSTIIYFTLLYFFNLFNDVDITVLKFFSKKSPKTIRKVLDYTTRKMYLRYKRR